MNKLSTSLCTAALFGFTFVAPAQADSLAVSGTIFKRPAGTTFDIWKVNMQAAGNFTVNLMAYEASESSTSTTGYYAADLNGDGELTWLDPETHFYLDHGQSQLDAADHLARCDDINNNCDTVNTSTIQLTSLDQAQGAADGSIHFRRDPAFDVTLAAGNYLFVVADYRLRDSEAAAGINLGDTFSPPDGFTDPILGHGDYRITLSSDTMNFSLSDDTITVSAVPIPAAIWNVGLALAGMGMIRRKKRF